MNARAILWLICVLLAAGCSGNSDPADAAGDLRGGDVASSADTLQAGEVTDGVPDVADVVPELAPAPDAVDTGPDCAGGCEETVCVPDCTDKECGDDGCGGLCGQCEAPFYCIAGMCGCEPACAEKECGDDGCGGSCGACADDLTCQGGLCQCAWGACLEDDDLGDVCGGASLGNCGAWACVEGCCRVEVIPPPECCQTAVDCRDCIHPQTGEVIECPESIPKGFEVNRCTKDVCGFGNTCKHFDMVVFGECNDHDDCTVDGCDPATGKCTHVLDKESPECEEGRR